MQEKESPTSRSRTVARGWFRFKNQFLHTFQTGRSAIFDI